MAGGYKRRDADAYSIAGAIKQHGIFYIKNRQTIEEIKKIDSNISFTWDKEDQLYIARYDKTGGKSK
jgi:hypothetical protein